MELSLIFEATHPKVYIHTMSLTRAIIPTGATTKATTRASTKATAKASCHPQASYIQGAYLSRLLLGAKASTNYTYGMYYQYVGGL
jgi:hypothetical protein